MPKPQAGSILVEVDRMLKQAMGSGLAELAHDLLQGAIANQRQARAQEVQMDPLVQAGKVLGVRPDAPPDVIRAARRVLMKAVKGGEKALGGDEQRAKEINAAADLLLKGRK